MAWIIASCSINSSCLLILTFDSSLRASSLALSNVGSLFKEAVPENKYNYKTCSLLDSLHIVYLFF